MKILVATPVYDGKLPIEVVRCILNEQSAAAMSGDELLFKFLPSCSHPAMGRNQLAQEFMDSDCERLVFLDADVTFEPGALLSIAKREEDLVGGAYRFKCQEEMYPVGWIAGQDLWATKTGLLEVQTLPGGFLSISRNVFEILREAYPERTYTHFGKKAHCYFQMPFAGGHLCGEDSYFCLEWRVCGGKVYLDPELTLTHWDFNTPYIGRIGSWLKSRALGAA